jgi:hypothetical protein
MGALTQIASLGEDAAAADGETVPAGTSVAAAAAGVVAAVVAVGHLFEEGQTRLGQLYRYPQDSVEVVIECSGLEIEEDLVALKGGR